MAWQGGRQPGHAGALRGHPALHRRHAAPRRRAAPDSADECPGEGDRRAARTHRQSPCGLRLAVGSDIDIIAEEQVPPSLLVR